MHVLIPSLAGRHKSKHNKRRMQGRIILVTGLGRVPFCEAEHFDEENTEKQKQNGPERQQAENSWQTRPEWLSTTSR